MSGYKRFIDELRDTYDAEKQLTKALPKLAKAASNPASNPKLRDAFESHLENRPAGAKASGACGRKVVKVQILSSAPAVARDLR
jgi:hypothetical protein